MATGEIVPAAVGCARATRRGQAKFGTQGANTDPSMQVLSFDAQNRRSTQKFAKSQGVGRTINDVGGFVLGTIRVNAHILLQAYSGSIRGGGGMNLVTQGPGNANIAGFAKVKVGADPEITQSTGIGAGNRWVGHSTQGRTVYGLGSLSDLIAGANQLFDFGVGKGPVGVYGPPSRPFNIQIFGKGKTLVKIFFFDVGKKENNQPKMLGIKKAG